MKKIKFTSAEASEYTDIPEATLRWWRHVGKGPKSFKLGAKRVWYMKDDLDEWMQDQYERTVTA